MVKLSQFHFEGMFHPVSYEDGMNWIDEAIDRVWDRKVEFGHLVPLYICKGWYFIKSLINY